MQKTSRNYPTWRYQGRRQDFSWGGANLRAKRASSARREWGGAERRRASCGGGLGVQPPAGSRGGAPGGRSPPENFWEIEGPRTHLRTSETRIKPQKQGYNKCQNCIKMALFAPSRRVHSSQRCLHCSSAHTKHFTNHSWHFKLAECWLMSAHCNCRLLLA